MSSPNCENIVYPQLADDDVRQYISKDQNRSQHAAPKVDIASIADPESACSVQRSKKIRLECSCIDVISAKNRNQPNADKECGLTKNEGDVPSTSKASIKEVTAINGGMHLLSLNDDCLETIFGYLKLKEQIRFARVCERFQDIFQMHCKRKYKDFKLSNIRGMPLWEVRNFFRFAGGNMVSITGTLPHKNRERIVEFISTFCRKLNRIRLDESQMQKEYLNLLLYGRQQLQCLTLRKWFFYDNSIKAMTHLNCLETLDLAENYELTGEFISKLVQLKVLNLYGCPNIQTSHLIDICKSLPKLQSLDIRECEQLSPSFFDVMVEHCKELEILKMSCPKFPYECVALLPRLKQLELLCFSLCGTAQKRLLAALVAHKADQLQVLKIIAISAIRAEHIALISQLRQLKTLFVRNHRSVIDGALIKFCKLQQLEDLTIEGYSSITNKGLLNLVKSCQRLHHLNIQFCKQITIEFLLETIRILKASGKRQKPLVLLAFGTATDYDEAIKYKEFKEAEKQSLISVVFDEISLDLG